VRRLCRLQVGRPPRPCRQRRDSGVLLGPLRRRFYEIAKAGSAPIAEEVLRRIAELYKIEAQIRGRSAAERQSVRQAESKPLGCRAEGLASSAARARLRQIGDRHRDPLRSQPLGGPRTLPSRDPRSAGCGLTRRNGHWRALSLRDMAICCGTRVRTRVRMQFEAKSREQLIAETMAELDEAFKRPSRSGALPPPVAVPELGAAGCVSCTHTRAILQQAGLVQPFNPDTGQNS
jgi:hypothetical protein